MPFYEYECGACGERHEALQKVSDEPLLECPACGKPSLKRLISAPSFRLKGGGWYETDFKAGNKRNLAESGDSKPGDPGKVSDAGGARPADTSKATGDAKPTPKAEPKPAAKPAPKGGSAE